MEKPFCHMLRVRYCECDAQKVVFNAKYAEYADIAATEFMRAVWGNYLELLDQGMDNQVVNLNISWKAPARFDDILEIQIHTEDIGTSSYTLKLDFYNRETEQFLATATVTYVMVNPDGFKKMAIPDRMRHLLIKGAPGNVIDHAGAFG